MFETGLVGTSGVKLPLSRFFNKVDRDTGLRPNPNLGQPKYLDNSSHSTYFGWQNTLKKRFSQNLSFDVNYTYSKVLSTGGGDTGTYFDGENFEKNQEFFDLKADRGPTPFDLTHVFSPESLSRRPACRCFSARDRPGVRTARTSSEETPSWTTSIQRSAISTRLPSQQFPLIQIRKPALDRATWVPGNSASLDGLTLTSRLGEVSH